MPKVAAYTVLQDQNITLVPAASHVYPTFSTENVSGVEKAVLSFVVNVFTLPAGMKVTINAVEVMDRTFTHTGERTLHETVPAGVLQDSANIMVVENTGPAAGGGAIDVQDNVMWYS
jgi:hypothetical protein